MSARVLSAGDRFADYVVVRLIGAGACGAVYEAEHPILGRRVALKITHPDVAADPDGRARALQEARALAELSHPNIVAIQNAGVTPEGQVWIATDLLHGWTLREMRDRPMPVEQALAVIAEICAGVSAAHEIQIVHRDLKPENVFVTRQMAVKVLDFTAAKAAGRGIVDSSSQIPAGKQARKVIGTLAYMSPEQIRGERVDSRTDVYSVGVMAYELIGPGHPFAEPDGTLPGDVELARRHLEVSPTPLTRLLPAVPSHVWEVIAEALVKDRGRRMASMRLFAEKIRAAREQHLKDREDENVAIAEEWRGAGAFAMHGTTHPRAAERLPRLPSRRVVVAGATVAAGTAKTANEPREPMAAMRAGTTGVAPTVFHITAPRPAAKRRVIGRAALVAVVVVMALLLVGAVMAHRFRGALSAGDSTEGTVR